MANRPRPEVRSMQAFALLPILRRDRKKFVRIDRSAVTTSRWRKTLE